MRAGLPDLDGQGQQRGNTKQPVFRQEVQRMDIETTAGQIANAAREITISYGNAKGGTVAGLILLAAAFASWGYIRRHYTEPWNYLDEPERVMLGIMLAVFATCAIVSLVLLLFWGSTFLSYVV